jgi:predicted Zn-dependent protease
VRETLRRIARKALAAAGKAPLQILIRAKRGALIRYANNGVHQNGFQDLLTFTLRLSGKEGPVYVESNDFSERGIEEAIRKLRSLVPKPLALSRVKKGNYPEVKEHFSLRLEKIPEAACKAIEEALRLIRKENASANGYYSAYERFFYLADSNGTELFHPATAARFGVTVTKGAGKGYFSFYHPDPKKLRVAPVVQEAVRLAEEASQGEITVKPGEYECVISPRAFLELIEPLRRHFDRRLYREGKSVFSGRLGKKIFSESFSLLESVSEPGQFGVPFDAEGAPRREAKLVERGVLKDLLAEGHSTRGLHENPFYPQNLSVKEGALSRADLFRGIRRGIFINKIWYHTLVRESAMEVTGLATAGSVYIEGGVVRGRVIQLRYHDSIFSILRNVIGASKERILLKDGEMGAAYFPHLWVSRLRVV